MPTRKKLIEVALPLEAINVASAREKSIRHGHPSTLHLWWARRPLAAARAVIFSSLVDDPDSPDALPAFVEACRELPKGPNATINDTPRMRLFDFIERLVQWESTTDEAILTTARDLINVATEGNPPPLLDPFAGGGSIPLEAQRLGLEAHASDLNPVAVMINKAQIEIPPRFANMPPVNPRDRERMSNSEGWKGAAGLAADVRYYGEWMRDKAFERIGHLYPKHNGETVIAWIWARTVKCPNPACGAQMPLISSYDLCKKPKKHFWIEPVVDKITKTVQFEVKSGQGEPSAPPKMGHGAKFRCLVCGEIAGEQHIKQEGIAKRMGSQMLAVITDSENGRMYYSPNEFQVRVAGQAEPSWLPNYDMASNPRHMSPPGYGLTTFADLFTPRQIVALTTFSDLIGELQQRIRDDLAQYEPIHLPVGNRQDEYVIAISTYLGMNISKQANRLSTLCFWDTGGEKIQQVFARQALPINWDYTEGNPFSDSSGNFLGQLDYMISTLNTLSPDVQAYVTQQDARLAGGSSSVLVSTDPPYYDSVPYADLSDFFYVWLRKSLQTLYPDLFGTLLVPKMPELVADHERWHGKENANQYFENGLREVFSQVRRIARIDLPTTIYYAFKQTENNVENADGLGAFASSTGWETMLEGLIGSGFIIGGTIPIRTEQASGLRVVGRNSLASSIVLVCRPRPDDAQTVSRSRFIDLLRKELPAALKEMQSGNIAPVDLAQASIGPGMAIYSRYKAVLEPDGKPLSVRTALGLINQELDAYLAEQDGDIDSDTRFAVAWFEQFGFSEGEFGLADVLARAKNTSVHGVEEAGVVQSGKGKVKLVHWKEYDPGAYDPQSDKRATVWEATHHLIERLSSHGEEGAALLMNRMKPEIIAEARNLAYRLYSICERKGWADHARDYNTLVIEWPTIAEHSAELRRAEAENRATRQERLFE